jgi:hypothetical protein
MSISPTRFAYGKHSCNLEEWAIYIFFIALYFFLPDNLNPLERPLFRGYASGAVPP